MQNLIIGVIGHIDHGKTSLVKSITGFDGDSTKEEKQRGMTLDISFSHLQGQNKSITFIDVPGHEDLVKNMIAGAFSLDGAVLIVSSKEGIKPQTIEHFEICRLLGISNIVVAITKSDLVLEDEITMISDDICRFWSSYNLVHPKIFATSIFDENSIVSLKKELFSIDKVYKKDLKYFRYFVDRVFSIKGSGTVVTGTVLSGSVAKKDKIYLCDNALDIQVRDIQTQHHTSDIGTISSRVALNLSNIETSQLSRGMQLTKKGFLRGFKTIDVKIELLDSTLNLHDNIYQFFIGSNRINVRVLEISKSEDKKFLFASLVCDEMIFAVFGDKFILRNSLSSIAGGEVLCPIADPMKKSQKKELLEILDKRNFEDAFRFLANIHKKGFGLISSPQRFGMTHDECIEIFDRLDDLFVDSIGLVVYGMNILDYLEYMILEIYKKNQYALISAQLLSDRFKWVSNYLGDFVLNNMVAKKILIFENGLFIKKDINFENISNFVETKIFDILENSKFSPDAPYNIYDSLDLDRKTGDRAFKNLTTAKKIYRLSHNYFITTTNLAKARVIMKEIIQKEGYLDINNLKTHLSLSRKYLIALLEYLDTLPYIKKVETKRFLDLKG